MYSSDAAGVAEPALFVEGFQVGSAATGSLSVRNRAVVVHDAAGTRIACGVAVETTDGVVAAVGAYPDFAGSETPAGSVVATSSGTTLTLAGTVAGLSAGACGLHVHAGTTCSRADDVGGHYYDDSGADPWTTTVTADADGVAAFSFSLAGFTVEGATMPVATHALVAHLPDGTRAGCGVLEVFEYSGPSAGGGGDDDDVDEPMWPKIVIGLSTIGVLLILIACAVVKMKDSRSAGSGHPLDTI